MSEAIGRQEPINLVSSARGDMPIAVRSDVDFIFLGRSWQVLAGAPDASANIVLIHIHDLPDISR